jgi:hypothetical protein
MEQQLNLRHDTHALFVMREGIDTGGKRKVRAMHENRPAIRLQLMK